MEKIEGLWQRPLYAAICENCDWAYLVPTNEQNITCPYCHKETLTPLETEDLPPISAPELVVPFAVSPERVQETIQAFARSFTLAPYDLKPANLQQRLHPVFIPIWLVDSDVAAEWQAEMGYNYQVVSHQEQFTNERWQTKELQETRVRWEQRIGRLARHYENLSAPALEEDAAIKAQLGDFETQAAIPYEATIIANALVRLPNRDQIDAWPDAQPRFQQRAADECRQAATADHVRQFRWQAQFNNQNWTQLLLPVYSTWYEDDAGNPLPVAINGRTGKLSGVKRASMKRAKKYTRNLAILAILLFLATLALLFFEPGYAFIAGFLTIMLGALSILPIAQASQFNRRQISDLPFEIKQTP